MKRKSEIVSSVWQGALVSTRNKWFSVQKVLPKNIFNIHLNPIWTGGGGAESAPLRFFLHISKTPGDIEKKLSDFNFTPLLDILRILSITIVVRCCHSNLLFPVCHVIFWVEKTKET